ncbi:stage III sporulation protein SpoIIIAB [Paenibacillus sp. GCM10012307]|uniref:Stage III sporulation protein AB n=1 Tax=Paenibacillus roseus TaxID=2798579 RepID=A0A934J3U9_9BACL|nr:stage III sporulation protein SpoIIIAB [Paenibacillus roseus]MBJ6364247.1 stage III sporulation protein AB [Paenibacillus roseus]
MIKIIGALLVLFAGTMIGFYQAGQFAARPRQIRQLAHGLQRLETEISYGFTPLPEALVRSAGASAEPIAGLLHRAAGQLGERPDDPFRESWELAVTEHWPYTAMRDNERNILIRLGSVLGISDREDQIKHLRLALLQLKSEEDAAREDQAKYEKMSKSLGLLSAALIVILMM